MCRCDRRHDRAFPRSHCRVPGERLLRHGLGPQLLGGGAALSWCRRLAWTDRAGEPPAPHKRGPLSMLTAPMTIFWLVLVFVVGLNVGSFLNVAIARLPLDKSLLWPGSRCGSCLQAIRWYDNLPVISYLRLGGRC